MTDHEFPRFQFPTVDPPKLIPRPLMSPEERQRLYELHTGERLVHPVQDLMETLIAAAREAGRRIMALCMKDPKFRREIRKIRAQERKAQIIEERAMRRIVRTMHRTPPLIHKGKAYR